MRYELTDDEWTAFATAVCVALARSTAATRMSSRVSALSLQRVDSQARIGQFVADRKRHYHGQARIEVSCPRSRLAFGIMR
jgi:hypothetical protein